MAVGQRVIREIGNVRAYIVNYQNMLARTGRRGLMKFKNLIR